MINCLLYLCQVGYMMSVLTQLPPRKARHLGVGVVVRQKPLICEGTQAHQMESLDFKKLRSHAQVLLTSKSLDPLNRNRRNLRKEPRA